MGVKEGDFVSICMADTPELIYTLYAINRIGAVANIISPMFTQEQISQHLNSTESKKLLMLDQLYPKLEKPIKESGIEQSIVVSIADSLPTPLKCIKLAQNKLDIMRRKLVAIPNGDSYVRWDDANRVCANDYKNFVDATYKKDRPYVMVYSSGSTGASKGILLSNDAINATIVQHQHPHLHFDRGKRFLKIIPSIFSTGVSTSLAMPLWFGTTVILEPKFDKTTFAKKVQKTKPHYFLVPTSHLEAMVTTNDVKDLSQGVYYLTGGEAMPAPLE